MTMAEVRFRVLEAGPHISVQDGGRPGLMRFGVPTSGPMDRLAFAAANLALGNAAGAPGIEVSLGGLALECLFGSATFAVAGGGFIVEAGAARFGSWRVATVRAGDRLALRPGPWGTWTYLAFAGALQGAEWLGSRATYSLSGSGGGRIVAGEEIVITDADLRGGLEGPIPCPVSARARAEIGVVLGPQDRFFPPEAIAALTGTPYRLTDGYDRMGVRLRGAALMPQGALSIPSEPIVRGSIQVSGDGIATVLLADHQTTGGYPKIATVLDSDLDGFVQLRPRDAVAFRPVTPDGAVVLARSRAGARARYFENLQRRVAAAF